MKVAIVTIYDFFNHGNRLQNYALEQTIIKMGHEVTTLAVSPKKIYSLVMPLANIVPFVPVVERMKNSKKHTKKFLHNVKIGCFSTKKLERKAKNFDAFVVGSDQVWNPKYMANKKISFLEFAEKEKCVAYAPSFGVEKLIEKFEDTFKNGLNHISHLSVRENEGAKIIENLCGEQAPVVLDPTMLLTKEEWEKFAQPVKNKPEKYVLTYFLAPKKEYKQKVEEIAQKFGLKVVNINKSFDKFFKTNPSEFVDLISSAELVCTNSFHGHAMSIALEKPFVSFMPFKSTKSRIATLLKMTGLEDRNFKTLEDENLFKLDFSAVKEKVSAEREKSLKFLTDAFAQVEKEVAHD